MTDTRNTQPRPIKAAHELMLTKLASLFPPRLPVDPDPAHFEDVADYLCDVARIVDQWMGVVGREIKSNARCSIDESCFTGVMLHAVEGFSTYECTRCAETIREDRNAA